VTRVILDAGPLVALLSVRDERHAWAQDAIQRLEPPLSTCDPVITEACYLLRHTRRGVDGVLSLVARGLVKAEFQVAPEIENIRRLMAKYASVPMSLADACLVRMSELSPRAAVLTMDRDFRVYRRNGRQAVPVIMPE
jgi:uncharacterized protein